MPGAVLAAAFAAGITLVQLRSALPEPAWPIAAMLTALILAMSLRRYRGRGGVALRTGLLAFAAGLAGFSYAAWRAEVRLADSLPVAWETVDIGVVGVVAELPRRFERGERFLFRVEQTVTPGAVVPGMIMLSWYRGWHDEEWFDGQTPNPGERWRFTVRLKRPHGHANPGGFDYEAVLIEQGVRATGYVRMAPAPERLATEVPGLGLAVERARAWLRDRVQRALAAAPYAGVLVALAIGDQGSIDADGWRVFAATGTTHLMSISGLHVTMLAGLVAAFVNVLWRRSERLTLRLPARRAAIAAGWAAALAYSLLAGFGVPAQRTLYMLSVAALALWSARATRPSRTLSLALVVVLLFDPWAVLAAGFWLSFGAVAVLMMAGSERRADGGWASRLRTWGWMQWAVTVGSAPLLVWLFQQVSLVSPLANAIAIPFISLVVTPLAVFGALGVALVPGVWVLELSHFLLAPLMGVLEWLAALPWAVWRQPEPPLPAVVIGMLGVVVLLLPRGVPGRWAGLALLVPAVLPVVDKPASGEAWIDLLDVGHGLAAVVRTSGHVLVFDTGPRFGPATDAGERILVPVLRAAGVDTIDTLVVSHKDSDHAGGAASVVEAIPVGRSLSSLPADSALRAQLPRHEACAAGQAWEWDGVRFRILHPLAADYAVPAAKTNHMSCVLRVDAGRRSLLLTADIEAPIEARLVAAGAALKADVLVVPHHGSRSSSTPEFVAAVGAPEIVATIGYRNHFRHPHPEVERRYAESGARLWRTDRDGAVRVRLGEEVRLSAWREERQRYWYGQ